MDDNDPFSNEPTGLENNDDPFESNNNSTDEAMVSDSCGIESGKDAENKITHDEKNTDIDLGRLDDFDPFSEALFPKSTVDFKLFRRKHRSF